MLYIRTQRYVGLWLDGYSRGSSLAVLSSSLVSLSPSRTYKNLLNVINRFFVVVFWDIVVTVDRQRCTCLWVGTVCTVASLSIYMRRNIFITMPVGDDIDLMRYYTRLFYFVCKSQQFMWIVFTIFNIFRVFVPPTTTGHGVQPILCGIVVKWSSCCRYDEDCDAVENDNTGWRAGKTKNTACHKWFEYRVVVAHSIKRLRPIFILNQHKFGICLGARERTHNTTHRKLYFFFSNS